MAVDHLGVIHAVWASTFPQPQYPRTLILYAKSTDQGTTWSTPAILVDDTNSWIVETHIVCDSQNRLYVSFDTDAQNPSQTKVNIITYNGSVWSEPITVSIDLGSSNNRLAIDHTDRVYCFWDGWSENNDKIFYRYLENGLWSDVIIPYSGLGDFYFLKNIVVDKLGNLHGVGYYSNKSVSYYYYDDVYYFYYLKSSNQWAPVEKIDQSPGQAWNGCDISLDTSNIPHFIWGEFFSESDSVRNFTSYIFPDETGWLPVDTVEKNHSSKNHQLLLDSTGHYQIIVLQVINNQRTKLVQYINIGTEWVEYNIDSSNFAMFYPDLEQINSTTVAVIYFKGGKVENDTIRDIFFSKYDLYTDIERSKLSLSDFSIYPNPFNTQTEISYTVNTQCQVKLDLFDINGKLITRLTDQPQPPGKYCIIWQGLGANAKEVSKGLYFVRLQAGSNIYTCKIAKQ
jgi:hypothetical protein